MKNRLSSSLLSTNLKIYTCKTIILPIVSYGCETWSLTLGEGCSLRLFENRVLRRIFESKRDKVTDKWRKLHNERLHNLYSPNNLRVIKLRRIRWAGHVEHMEERRIQDFGEETLGKETIWESQA